MTIGQRNWLGKILFFVGAILAIASGAKMPREGADFPDTLGLFVIAFVIGIIGNIIWHKTERKLVMAELESNSNGENPIEILKQIKTEIETLKNQIDTLSFEQIMLEIDKISSEKISPFIEKRKTLIDILGQEKGAEILLEVAYGERMLNRTWSAVSDDHLPEAKHSIDQSLKSYNQALVKLGENK